MIKKIPPILQSVPSGATKDTNTEKRLYPNVTVRTLAAAVTVYRMLSTYHTVEQQKTATLISITAFFLNHLPYFTNRYTKVSVVIQALE